MGELILGRKADGSLVIERADDEFDVDASIFEDIGSDPSSDIYVENNSMLKAYASGQFLAYVVTNRSAGGNVHLVRTEVPPWPIAPTPRFPDIVPPPNIRVAPL